MFDQYLITTYTDSNSTYFIDDNNVVTITYDWEVICDEKKEKDEWKEVTDLFEESL